MFNRKRKKPSIVQTEVDSVKTKLQSLKVDGDAIICIRCDGLDYEDKESIAQMFKKFFDKKDFEVEVLFLPKESKLDSFKFN